MKTEIIIDCNSFSHLSAIEINRQKPSTWLWKYFDVKTSTVIRDEFSIGIQNAPANSKAIRRRLDNNDYILRPNRFTALQNNWLTNFYYMKSLSNNDKGERHLICSIIELHYYKKMPRGILVTDDLTAIDYFLDSIKKDTYFGSLWTSLDLLIYLYFYIKEVNYDDVATGIRDIISKSSFSAKRYKEKGNTDEFARQRMLGDYMRKLNNIKQIKQTLP